MQKIFTTAKEFTQFRNECEGKSIGVVPTMGNLHQGHLSLAEKSLQENEITIVTIFVNPKQFGPNEDFDSYPRTQQEDIEKLNSLLDDQSGEMAIFAPWSNDEIYPPGFSTTISVEGITSVLCGQSRPGHFAGVTTVVYRLFALTRPTRAYFGQKDYQQYLVIKKMTEDLSLPIEIIPMPIIRDQDGLALSSRNQYMSSEERKRGLTLPHTLNLLAGKSITMRRQNEFSPKLIRELITSEKAKSEEWDYLELYDAENLSDVTDQTKKLLFAGSFKVGKTRLIDNQLVDFAHA